MDSLQSQISIFGIHITSLQFSSKNCQGMISYNSDPYLIYWTYQFIAWQQLEVILASLQTMKTFIDATVKYTRVKKSLVIYLLSKYMEFHQQFDYLLTDIHMDDNPPAFIGVGYCL